MKDKKGSLVVVGSGIKAVGQLTQEAIAWIKLADKILHVVPDPVVEDVLQRLNPNTESLKVLYAEGKPRMDTYRAMVDRMVACVHEGMRTCAVFYGHPGVFAYPPHSAIRKLRAEGYEAFMLPGISAEDCMFAELGIDPATHGCQSYEATAFVIGGHTVNPMAALVLWQVGVFGNATYSSKLYDLSGISILIEYLSRFYPPEHEVCVYEASTFPGCSPRISWTPLSRLQEQCLTAASTLYVPPAKRATRNVELCERLGVQVIGSQ